MFRIPWMMDMRYFLVVWWIIHVVLAQKIHIENSGTENTREYCEDEVFTATCAQSEAIFVQTATYGRMRIGRCITSDYGNMGCSANVLHQLDSRCSGRQKCEFMVSTLLHGVPENPCPRDFRSYLEASYVCLPVVQSGADGCYGRTPVLVTGPVGYISSQVTKDTGCGSIDNPWTLRVQPGQTIALTLLDFSLAMYDKIRGSSPPIASPSAEVCSVYAIIKETGASHTQTLCGGRARVSHVYRSQSSQVEVRVVTKRGQHAASMFLLKYEATGCADPPLSKSTLLRREGSAGTDVGAVVSCEDGTEAARVVCDTVTGRWSGAYANCSHDALSSGPVLGASERGASGAGGGAGGLSVVIVVLVALMVGVAVLVAGVVCLRRYHRRQSHQSELARKEMFPGPDLDTNYKTMDPAYGGGNNDYYRTWQLTQHGQHKMHRPAPPPRCDGMPPPPYEPTSCTCDGDDPAERYVEHVYESPKFDRRAMDDPNTRTSYFELDTDAIRHMQSGNAHVVL